MDTGSFFRFVSMLATLALLSSCSSMQTNVAQEENRKYYTQALREVHAIECDNLKKINLLIHDTDVYQFRSAAFQAVLKNPDRKILARYEVIYQSLADLEHQMEPEERESYQATVREIYKDLCR